MIKVSDGLKKWLEIRKWTNRQLCDALGNYDEGTISKVINGEMEPSKQLMKKLMILTGLDFELFYFDRNIESQGEDG